MKKSKWFIITELTISISAGILKWKCQNGYGLKYPSK